LGREISQLRGFYEEIIEVEKFYPCSRTQIQVNLANIYSFGGLAADPHRWTVMSYTKIVHERYNPSRYHNDIALVKLPTSPPENGERCNQTWL
jgi:hypothetical protein